jgi:hypothetical protein
MNCGCYRKASAAPGWQMDTLITSARCEINERNG